MEKSQKFGTAPVFFTAISTILGAIMFLRFGFAVGNVGLAGTIAIVLVGHAVTIPTAMAVAEIATNQKVEGGGEYYIISRSFGLVIGSTIGIALYLSQAISVAFYVMAFAEAFTSLFEYLIANFNLPAWVVWLLEKRQTVSIPALFLLTAIVLAKGAELGVKTLYVVVFTLGISMVAFFLGDTDFARAQRATGEKQEQVEKSVPLKKDTSPALLGQDDTLVQAELKEAKSMPSDEEESEDRPFVPLGFFAVFAIIFPAFTGMTAGVGLSGDLKDPGKSIPLGTLGATIFGMIVYLFIAQKLASSASPTDLADTSKLVMADIAWQGWWIIPLGLAAATISSALGSILVAPRTLQAIARDGVIPSDFINKYLSKGRGPNDEPFNASVITVLIGFFFLMLGALDMVAEVISMFFMVTYGSLCLISFLQHFAADPSYRPRFSSRWYLSLFGAIACFVLMFFMNSFYAFIAIVLIVALYFVLASYNPEKRSLAVIFQGVLFQFSRQMQVFLQSADKEQNKSWRPSVVAVSENTFKRLGGFDMLRWLSQKYGFGTYIHQIRGYLSKKTHVEAKNCKDRLIKMAEVSNSKVVVDTLISPSYTSTIAQVIQLPGVAGTENNLIILEFSKGGEDNLEDIIDNFKLIKSVDFDVAVLGSSERGYGLKKEIHLWITNSDYENANLMILLAYIIVGHPDWKGAQIKIFTIFPEETLDDEKERLFELIKAGQLPISTKNIRFIQRKQGISNRQLINETSIDADLTIIGLREEAVKKLGVEVFQEYTDIGNMLFVNSNEQKAIK